MDYYHSGGREMRALPPLVFSDFYNFSTVPLSRPVAQPSSLAALSSPMRVPRHCEEPERRRGNLEVRGVHRQCQAVRYE